MGARMKSVTVDDMVAHLEKHHALPQGNGGTVQRYHYYAVQRLDHSSPPDRKPLVKCNDYWSWCVKDGLLMTRELSCSCIHCLAGKHDACELRAMTLEWVAQP